MAFVGFLINGISLGGIYALIALGYTMVYGIAKMLNFAHGDIIMVGGYAAFFTLSLTSLPPVCSVLAAVIVCTLVGVAVEKIAYKPLRSASSLTVLITAIGVSYFLQNLAMLLFKSDARNFKSVVSFEGIKLGNRINVSGESVVTIIVSVIIMLALTLFVNLTKPGQAMLAVSEDKGAAQCMGINVNSTISMTFAIGSALAAVAGVLFCSTYPQIYPYVGAMPGIKAFVAAVLGGVGSIPGAMLGGILLGIIEILARAYISTQLADAIVFAVLIVILLVKPTGLLGKKTREKV